MERGKLTMKAVAFLCSLSLFTSPARAAQQGKAEPPKVIRKAAAALQASAINREEVVYPQQALTARVSGTVIVEVRVDEGGVVTSARALSGHQLLKEAAVDAASGWTFKPTLVQGKPVKVVGTLALIFRLPEYILRDPLIVIARLKQQIAIRPSNSILRYQLGRAYEDNRQYEDALREYGQAVGLKPTYGDARLAIGDLNAKLNQYKEALDAYNQAVLLDLTSEAKAGAYRAIALIYFKRDQFKEAVEPFKRAIALAPQGSMHFNLGLTYLMLSDKTSAMEQYRLLKVRNSVLADQLLKKINGAQ